MFSCPISRPARSALCCVKVGNPEELIRQAIEAGDSLKANELIVRHFAPIVLATIRKLVRGTILASDAEDLCQDTLVKTFKGLGAGKLAGKASLLGYIVGIARYTVFHARDSWIVKVRNRSVDVEALERVAGYGRFAPDELGGIDPDSIDVDELLGRLDADERVIMSLWLEGMPYDAIGRMLRIKANTANRKCLRARDKLKVVLLDRGPEGPAVESSSRRRG